ncbi:MAG TPA: hypothetical protein VJB87_00310, partial [Candidatus Nanoarchaeia archaeon]|nr:hypothetical protein [Candidatus Nanoarchaeia archaeon]
MKTYSLLLALLFLISCSSIPFLNNSQNTIEEKVTGARGIIINFVKDQPPTQITEKERFYIALTAENNLPEATTVTTIMYPDLTLTMTPDDLQNFQSITLEGSNYNDLQELSAAAKTTGDKKATKFTPGTISQTTAKITEDKRILLGPYTILLDHNYPEEETKFFLDYAYDIKATM